MFCGIAEMYGFRDEIHKISVGYRLLERFWGQGIATKALGLMIDYLYNETDIEIITASTMVENRASAKVLLKNGFELVASGVGEDWGYGGPTAADKRIRSCSSCSAGRLGVRHANHNRQMDPLIL